MLTSAGPRLTPVREAEGGANTVRRGIAEPYVKNYIGTISSMHGTHLRW